MDTRLVYGYVFNWRLIEPKEGKFEWVIIDKFVEETQKRGIKFCQFWVVVLLGKQNY